MLDGIRAAHERTKAGQLNGRCSVQHDGNLARRVSRVMAQAVVKRLHRVSNRMRVEEVHKYALSRHTVSKSHQRGRAGAQAERGACDWFKQSIPEAVAFVELRSKSGHRDH